MIIFTTRALIVTVCFAVFSLHAVDTTLAPAEIILTPQVMQTNRTKSPTTVVNTTPDDGSPTLLKSAMEDAPDTIPNCLREDYSLACENDQNAQLRVASAYLLGRYRINQPSVQPNCEKAKYWALRAADETTHGECDENNAWEYIEAYSNLGVLHENKPRVAIFYFNRAMQLTKKWCNRDNLWEDFVQRKCDDYNQWIIDLTEQCNA